MSYPVLEVTLILEPGSGYDVQKVKEIIEMGSNIPGQGEKVYHGGTEIAQVIGVALNVCEKAG